MIDVAGRGNTVVPMIWYSLWLNPKTNCDDGSSATRLTVAMMLASVCILSRRGALADTTACITDRCQSDIASRTERVMLAAAPT